MSREQHIYWRDDMGKNDAGLRFANVHLLVGYTTETVADYNRLAGDIRETFPDAPDDKMVCGRVLESDRVKSFTVLSYNDFIVDGEYPGWKQHESNDNPPYRW